MSVLIFIIAFIREFFLKEKSFDLKDENFDVLKFIVYIIILVSLSLNFILVKKVFHLALIEEQKINVIKALEKKNKGC